MFSPICQQTCWPSGVTSTPAECASVLTIPSSTLGTAWLSGTFAENGSATTNWRLAAVSAAIGTIAISGYPIDPANHPGETRRCFNYFQGRVLIISLRRDRPAETPKLIKLALHLFFVR